MYRQVTTPGIITQEWLDEAFAPLRNYLEREFPDRSELILGFMVFMCNENNKFYYKNSWFRTYIVFDQEGNMIDCAETALQQSIKMGIVMTDNNGLSQFAAITPFNKYFFIWNVLSASIVTS